MKIKVICISDSDKHFSSAIDEYCKRLGKDVEILSIKPEKNGSRDQIIKKETEKIIEKI
jgi:23S rRNA pseudoU1915 N3-methylase RlmH